MATAMKTKNTKTEPVKTESAVEEKGTVEVKEEKKVTKTYGPNDGIPCKSITQGGLYMPGLKSNILYTWVDSGDVVEVEYQDDSLYSVGELEDVILDLDPASMKATILSLPEGAQTSISHLASKMVSDGRLDSVKKIKILDEIFDTDMTVMTGLFN